MEGEGSRRGRRGKQLMKNKRQDREEEGRERSVPI